jgi:hypothetical protein
MRQHIRKEEQRTYNMARVPLNRQDLERLTRDFEEVEQEQIRLAFHEWNGV